MLATIRIILSVLAFAVGTTVLFAWQFLQKWLRWGDPRRPALLWHRMVLLLTGIRLRTSGTPATGRPLLIAANHVSWTDIMVLGSIAPVNFVAKAEVASWPLLGRLFRTQNSIFVDRQARHRSQEQTRDVAETLAKGDPLVLFAEGTTGCGNRLLPFKSTLFGAAAQLSKAGEAFAVQPVAIFYSRLHGMPMGRRHRARYAWIGDEELVPHLRRLIVGGPLEVQVRFGEPIAFFGANRKEVAAKAQAAVRDMIDEARGIEPM